MHACAYRLPAVPLHRAVVVFHHPGMVQQLSDSKTPFGVHLEDTDRNYTSIRRVQTLVIPKNILHIVQRKKKYHVSIVHNDNFM